LPGPADPSLEGKRNLLTIGSSANDCSTFQPPIDRPEGGWTFGPG
jgi:hypothetical protein